MKKGKPAVQYEPEFLVLLEREPLAAAIDVKQQDQNTATFIERNDVVLVGKLLRQTVETVIRNRDSRERCRYVDDRATTRRTFDGR